MVKKIVKKKIVKKEKVKKPVETERIEDKIGFEPKEVPSDSKIARAVKNDALLMKESLSKQPKVSFLVPLSPDEKEGAFETVCLNGYLIKIKKGVMVEIPKQVAEVLAESYRIQMSAGSKSLISRNSKVQEALE